MEWCVLIFIGAQNKEKIAVGGYFSVHKLIHQMNASNKTKKSFFFKILFISRRRLISSGTKYERDLEVMSKNQCFKSLIFSIHAGYLPGWDLGSIAFF